MLCIACLAVHVSLEFWHTTTKVYSDPPEAAHTAHTSHCWMRSRFDIKAVAENWLRHYESHLDGISRKSLPAYLEAKRHRNCDFVRCHRQKPRRST